MAFCGKCGTEITAETRFCPACGTAVQGRVVPSTDYSARLQNLNNTADTTEQFDPDDVVQNKAMAILAYFGLLVLIPIFAARESKFARYHANQGLILCIAAIAYGVAYGILSSIILVISWRLYFLITIMGLVGLVFLVWAIIGIVNAATGKAKELPLIGHFKLLK